VSIPSPISDVQKSVANYLEANGLNYFEVMAMPKDTYLDKIPNYSHLLHIPDRSLILCVKSLEGVIMPFVLSPIIELNSPGMWAEGAAYQKKSIYSIEPGKNPPVNYDEHIIRSHSLTHIETPAHTQKNGKRLESYYADGLTHFYGKTLVIKLSGDKYKAVSKDVSHWIITKEDIQDRLDALKITETPNKILITTEIYYENSQGYHDPNYVLTLSQSAADFLISNKNIDLYGTSWKSSDFNPGQAERPIHNTLFQKALILENLKLKDVPEGIYFMTAFPLPFNDASESPVVPVLFTKDELFNSF
jgi:arylformamidase